MLRYAQAVIIPIVLGILISHALEPLVGLSSGCGSRVPLAAAIVLVTVVSAGGVMLYQLRYQATEIVEQLPEGARRLRRIIEGNRRSDDTAIEKVQKAATELERAANAAAPTPAPGSAPRVQLEQAPFRVSRVSGLGIVEPVRGRDAGRDDPVPGVLPARVGRPVSPQAREDRRSVTGEEEDHPPDPREIDYQIERFLIVQLFTSAVVGVATWLALRWIGFEQAAFWGLIAGVFNSIPYFGPVLVTGAIGVVAFLQFGEVRPILLAAGSALVITTLEGFLLTPFLSSRAARMNAVAVFVGLLFWGWVWGVWGALLAVPMLMIVKAVCDRVEDSRPSASCSAIERHDRCDSDSDVRAESSNSAACGEERLPQVADLRDPRRDVAHGEVLDLHAALDLLPGDRRRHGGLRTRPHRIDRRQRAAPRVLVVVDQHAAVRPLGDAVFRQ